MGQPSRSDEKRLQSLDEDYQSRLEALKNYGHADDLTILSKEPTKVQGLPAIISTMKYGDSSTGRYWFDKDLLIHTEDDQTTYDIGLHCSPDDRSALEPLFDEIVKTFRVLGPRA
ncbi:MAG: hypothetical protein WCE61_16210 [Candidatus Acidiferrum sp.]